MQLIHTNKIVSTAILIGTLLLLSPHFAVAGTSIYQEVITSSNSGGQTSSSHSIEQTDATVEVMSTTIINGEEYNYYFSTSTSGGVEQQVTIQNGAPGSSETRMTDPVTTTETASQREEGYRDWLSNMINLLNYLQLYVANTF